MADKRPKKRLRQLDALLRDTGGATAIEYGILVMMIGLALLGMITLTDISNRINNTFNYVADTMSR
jgi:pilus assembly protein Flp/PilA